MTIFLRLLADADKGTGLSTACARLRQGETDPRLFEVAPEAFDAVPGKPFAYWVSDGLRRIFTQKDPFEYDGRTACGGMKTQADERFLRGWWETTTRTNRVPLCKGGVFSKYYADPYLVIDWRDNGAQARAAYEAKASGASWGGFGRNEANYFRPGLTWPRRTNGLSFRVMPAGCIFADKGPAAFVAEDDPDELLALACLLNSNAFGLLVSVQLARVELAQSYEVGLIQQTPIPTLTAEQRLQLAALARRAWSLKRTLDTTTENSHAFLLPAALRRDVSSTDASESATAASNTTVQEHNFSVPSVSSVVNLSNYDPPAIVAELARIQAEIDALAFDLYGFEEADRIVALNPEELTTEDTEDTEEEEEKESSSSSLSSSVSSVSSVVNLSSPTSVVNLSSSASAVNLSSPASVVSSADLLSWALGVAFGRFDWRLATGERDTLPEPDPFDPLPAKSPGMLPDGAAPFHDHAGILVDDPGHPHDLAHLIEEVLGRVDTAVPDDVRRLLQRDFFPFHLQRYSKSRRKAPIYWPLATGSGGYTLWLYYPSLDSETLYTAVNDLVEPKLKQVGSDLAALRNRGVARSRDDERRFESLQTLELELIELRDTLLRLAPNYKPNHDDGVQITAAPLWPLFRHKPWQKVLKETWEKLSKGDYDWAHLAMSYWPERVREKCKTDKSLAIAHGLEDLYIEPAAKPKNTRGRKKTDSGALR